MAFQLTAFTILAVFYASYFTKLLWQKKKGIRTTQIGSGKIGLVKWIERTMMVSAILVVIAELASIALDITTLPPFVRWIGAGAAALGVILFISAMLAMRDNWRVGASSTDKTELVTSGIFSVSRNPAFLGFDLVYIGLLFMFFNWLLLAASVIAALMLHLQIVNVEEDLLCKTFGESYLEYKKKVDRYWGRKQ